MTALKLNARINMQGNTLRVWFRFVAVKILRFMALYCTVYPVMSIFYPVGTLVVYTDEIYAKIFIVLSAVTSVFLFVFSFFAEAYYEATVFYIQDKNGPKPENSFRIKRGIGFMRLKAAVFFMKFLFAFVFFFPSVFMLISALSSLMYGDMIKSTFYVLLAADALLFITGAVFYYFTSGRYYLTDYIFYGNPMTNVRNTISSSAYLTRGKLVKIGIRRLGILPWRLFGAFAVTFPFSQVFCAFIKASLCDRIYGEKKCPKGKSAVTFYIGKHTVMTCENSE